MTARAVIFGCEGPELTKWERAFFADSDPFGFILFKRNYQTPDQIRALTADLRDAVGRLDAPVLIDQEGGRVARLQPPQWRAMRPGRDFGNLAARNRDAGCKAVTINARLLAAELVDLGIDVDCVPLLDLSYPDTHSVIGDRAFADTPEVVALLGRQQGETLLQNGVMPIIKHIPGHGRARVDSHEELPVVDTPRGALETSDFEAFRRYSDAPWAMTAHVVYSDIDAERPATTSRAVIDQVIRGFIGFDGLLLSDDLSMQALAGSLGARAEASLTAGCDVALHCNGNPDEMTAVAAATGPLSPAALDRIARAAARRQAPSAFDRSALLAELAQLLGRA